MSDRKLRMGSMMLLILGCGVFASLSLALFAGQDIWGNSSVGAGQRGADGSVRLIVSDNAFEITNKRKDMWR